MLPEQPQEPWFQAGLRFECQRCGACCTSHGDYAYVYLRVAEAQKIAQFLGREWAQFEAESLIHEDGYTRLKAARGACPYLGQDHRCGIYPVRPMQCRTWPFWEENLERDAWEHNVRAICPGIGRGELYPASEIVRIAAHNERWYESAEDDEPPQSPGI